MDPSVSVVNMQQMKRCNLPGGKIEHDEGGAKYFHITDSSTNMKID